MTQPPPLEQVTDHDSLFKEFLRRFLPEVMVFFFPRRASEIDWGTVTFLDQEVPLNLPEKLKRIADIVVEVRRLDGEEEQILIHVEVEASRKREMPRRM
ncbi:MAG TPA: hypothetical protein VLL52_11690, partial [Anaerolineae bacterium]|nr:hypothetical protein [Anaerolineae bacterium]